MKILLVEDNAAIRQLLGTVLAPLMPEIVECEDGAGALAAYESHQPDVVLMDIAMPGLDGIVATAALVATHPEACVVIVTNHDDAGLRNAAWHAGARGYALKANLLELVPLLERLGCVG